MPTPSRRAIRTGTEFRSVYARGARARRDGITVFVARADATFPGIGVVVRRSVGGAVVRNRTKRRLREIVKSLKLPPSSDVVIRAEGDAGRSDSATLARDVTAALDSVGGGR